MIYRLILSVSLFSILLMLSPTKVMGAPVWEWYKYIFPVCWFGNDCFKPPERQQPIVPINPKDDFYPYYAVLRVYCVDTNDPNRDRGDSNLTVKSKVSTEDARAMALAQIRSRDVCKDNGDSTRMQSSTKQPEFVGSS